MYLNTHNDINLELNKQTEKKDDIKSDMLLPRYSTTIDNITNKAKITKDDNKIRDRLIKDNNNYRISRINIDSRYRNKDPKNIIDKYIKISKPFTFTKNSDILKIEIKDHNFNIGDYIIISNVNTDKKTLKPESLTLKKYSTYLYINEPDHGFSGSNNKIKISDVQNEDPNNYFFGNIPLSVINNEHDVILIVINGLIDNNNYMVNLNIISNTDYTYTENIFTIERLTLNGVHIKYINANYPINNDFQQGYHIIREVGLNYIKIKLSVSSNDMNTDEELGNNDILIGNILSTVNGYSDPDYYKFDLKKTYYKVRKLKLVSTEIPNTEMLVKNSNNNLFYWQIQDDGDYIYSINITPGNYIAETLKIEMINKISLVSRQFGSYLNKTLYSEKCIPNIIINPYNNIFSIEILSNIILSKNISLVSTSYDDGYKRINITHPYHNLYINSKIIISNAVNVLDSIEEFTKYYIPINIINREHIIENILGINNYIIKLPKYNKTIDGGNSNQNISFGGDAVNILFPLTIRLRFDYSNTIGNILGFKNIGDSSSITIFDKTITNQTNYNNSSNLNSVGLIDYNVPILNFRTYPYILMVSDLFCSNVNYKDSTGVFAKLFLAGDPGSMIYDNYVQITETIPNAVSFLNQLEFKFLTPDGDQYNFNGQDHSYTLEIYEELEENK